MDKIIELVADALPQQLFLALILLGCMAWGIKIYYKIETWSDTFRNKKTKLSVVIIIALISIYFATKIFYNLFPNLKYGNKNIDVAIFDLKNDHTHSINDHLSDVAKINLPEFNIESIDFIAENDLDAISYCKKIKAEYCITGSFADPFVNIKISHTQVKNIGTGITLNSLGEYEIFSKYLKGILSKKRSTKNFAMEKAKLKSRKKKKYREKLNSINRYIFTIGAPSSYPSHQDINMVNSTLSSLWENTSLISISNSTATIDNIYKSMSDIKHNVSKHDQVWLYISGIVIIKNNSPYLKLHDGKLIPIIEFYRWVNSLPSQKNLIVLDSCHSERIFDDAIFQNTNVKENLVLSSSSADGMAYYIDDLGASLFTSMFIKGLEGEADYNKDGIIEGKEISLFVEHAVSSYKLHNIKQQPKFINTNIDDIVLKQLR